MKNVSAGATKQSTLFGFLKEKTNVAAPDAATLGAKTCNQQDGKGSDDAIADVDSDDDVAVARRKSVKRKSAEGSVEGTLKEATPPSKPETAKKLRPSTESGVGSDGAPVPYSFLAKAFVKMEATQARTEIVRILTDAFREISTTTPEDLLPAIYLCVNKLGAAHEGIELGIGEGIIMKVLVQVTGRSMDFIREEYRRVGDLGDVACSSRTNQRTLFPLPPLMLRNVYKELFLIAKASGKSVMNEKIMRIQKLLGACKAEEAKYIVRALLGKLRIHVADKTVISALAGAFSSGKSKGTAADPDALLNRVYSELPVWEIIVPALLDVGAVTEELLKRCKLTPGVPVGPMLAKPTKGITEVVDRFDDCSFTCEFKYDGERAQIHKLSDGTIKIYSRNAEDNTQKYPDIVTALPKAIRPDFMKSPFIIDAEAVAFDPIKKEILPFQVLQGRKRKDVQLHDVSVNICLFAFDILLLGDEPLHRKPLVERREILKKTFDEIPGEFAFAQGRDSTDLEQIQEFLNESVKGGCEGLMVKALDGPMSTYEPANRSQNWLKVKKDYLQGVGDSMDLVPIGGYFGRGKRTGTFGGFLVGCYDADNEEFQTTCKLGTGFSDENLAEFSEFYHKEGRILEKYVGRLTIADT